MRTTKLRESGTGFFSWKTKLSSRLQRVISNPPGFHYTRRCPWTYRNIEGVSTSLHFRFYCCFFHICCFFPAEKPVIPLAPLAFSATFFLLKTLKFSDSSRYHSNLEGFSNINYQATSSSSYSINGVERSGGWVCGLWLWFPGEDAAPVPDHAWSSLSMPCYLCMPNPFLKHVP